MSGKHKVINSHCSIHNNNTYACLLEELNLILSPDAILINDDKINKNIAISNHKHSQIYHTQDKVNNKQQVN